MTRRKNRLFAYLLSAVMIFSVFATSTVEVLAYDPGLDYPYIAEDLIPYPFEENDDEDPTGEDITDAFTCEYFLSAVRSLPEVPNTGPIFTSHVEEIESFAIDGSLASSGNITNLDGIEYFTGLVLFEVTQTQITELDLSSNTLLTSIRANNNQLENVVLPQSGNLAFIHLAGNYLTDLDVRNALDSDIENLFLFVNGNDMTDPDDVRGWANYFDEVGGHVVNNVKQRGFTFWAQRGAEPPPIEPNPQVTVAGSTLPAGTGNNQSGEGLHAPGSTVTIRAGTSPVQGRTFYHWRVIAGGVTLADANNAVTTFTMPNVPVAVEAVWQDADPSIFTVSITGSQLPPGNATNQSGQGTYRQGDTVAIRAGTRDGYTFEGWTASPAVPLANPSFTTTYFTMPASNVTVVATWRSVTDLPAFEVIVHGSELPVGTAFDQSGAGRYDQYQLVTIRAGARAGYLFNNWTVNVGGVTLSNINSPNATFTMPAGNVTVTANWRLPTRAGVVLATLDDRDRETPIGSLYRFPDRRRGYGEVTALEVAIFNYEDTSTGELIATLSGPDANSFILRGGISGGGVNDSRRSIASVSADNHRANAFSVAPRTGLSERSTPYTATVTVSSVTGDRISVSFDVSFLVTWDGNINTFTLTLRASTGGEISLDGSSYGATRTGEFYYGERITISARPNRDFDFDRWRYSWGDTQHEFRTETTFTMPDRNVTVWADFDNRNRDRPWDWDWDRDRPWDPNWPHAPHAPHTPAPITPALPPGTLPPPPQAPPAPALPVQPPILTPMAPPAPPANVQPATIPLTVNINGRPLPLSGQPAVISQGVSLIPVSEVFRAIEFSVDWNATEQIATLRRGNIVIVVTEGSRIFTVNGINHSLPAPATLINGYLMVPFVEILESIGARTHRDANNVIQIFTTR
ncbi:MAG: stalk domain-containing protein [Defluviitaleaceae bacterium]|nr:stalk domain-containing protein [Defluviitaleaceae bacterium]